MARIYQRKKLRVGDHVEVLQIHSQSDYSFLVGTRGVVKGAGHAGAYAVQFAKRHRDLNTCDGCCLPNRGLWLGRSQLKLVSDHPVYYPSDQARVARRNAARAVPRRVHNADEREELGRRGRVGTDPVSQARAHYRNTVRTLQILDTTEADAARGAMADVRMVTRKEKQRRSRKPSLNEEGFGVIGEL